MGDMVPVYSSWPRFLMDFYRVVLGWRVTCPVCGMELPEDTYNSQKYCVVHTSRLARVRDGFCQRCYCRPVSEGKRCCGLCLKRQRVFQRERSALEKERREYLLGNPAELEKLRKKIMEE